jgi:hypothetical protein
MSDMASYLNEQDIMNYSYDQLALNWPYWPIVEITEVFGITKPIDTQYFKINELFVFNIYIGDIVANHGFINIIGICKLLLTANIEGSSMSCDSCFIDSIIDNVVNGTDIKKPNWLKPLIYVYIKGETQSPINTKNNPAVEGNKSRSRVEQKSKVRASTKATGRGTASEKSTLKSTSISIIADIVKRNDHTYFGKYREDFVIGLVRRNYSSMTDLTNYMKTNYIHTMLDFTAASVRETLKIITGTTLRNLLDSFEVCPSKGISLGLAISLLKLGTVSGLNGKDYNIETVELPGVIHDELRPSIISPGTQLTIKRSNKLIPLSKKFRPIVARKMLTQSGFLKLSLRSKNKYWLTYAFDQRPLFPSKELHNHNQHIYVGPVNKLKSGWLMLRNDITEISKVDMSTDKDTKVCLHVLSIDDAERLLETGKKIVEVGTMLC